MANIDEILDVTKPHFIGKIVTAPQCGIIKNVLFPVEKNIFTVRASDIEDARIRVLNDYIPVFAHSIVSYPGQPLLAVFGKTIEEVELFIAGIRIEMYPEDAFSETNQTQALKNKNENPLNSNAQISVSEINISNEYSNEKNSESSSNSKKNMKPEQNTQITDYKTQNLATDSTEISDKFTDNTKNTLGSIKNTEIREQNSSTSFIMPNATDNIRNQPFNTREPESVLQNTYAASIVQNAAEYNTKDRQNIKSNAISNLQNTFENLQYSAFDKADFTDNAIYDNTYNQINALDVPVSEPNNQIPLNPHQIQTPDTINYENRLPDTNINEHNSNSEKNSFYAQNTLTNEEFVDNTKNNSQDSTYSKSDDILHTLSKHLLPEPVPFGSPFRFSNGNIENYFKETDKIIESEFEISSYSNTMLSSQRFYANTENDLVYISCPTQWPIHVRDSVASCLKISRNSVIISERSFHTNYDHMLINPSVLSAIVAFAAKKTGALVELQVNITVQRPHSKYHFLTQLDSKNRPVAYKVRADIDFGAFPIFTEEACYNIMAGLIPCYKVHAFEINIISLKSNTPPANFFGDIGFSGALTATEDHFNYIISTLNTFPSDWKIDNLKEGYSSRRTVIETTSPEGMKQCVEDLTRDSIFNRKFSIYNQFKNDNKSSFVIMPYSRGIGMATGQGIIGFSNKFHYISQYSVALTVTGKEVLVYIGFSLTRYLKRIYRSIVQKYFSINTNNIIFLDVNQKSSLDSGPNTLSRATGMVLFLLENACIKLKERIQEGCPLPATETGFTTGFENADYFISSCSAAISIDIHLDMIKIIPVLDNITVRIKTGKVFDVTGFQNTIKHTISRTISEICPISENRAQIDLKIRSNPYIFSGFSLNMIKALTTTALTSALNQALNAHIKKIPISEEDIFELIQMGKEA